MPEQRSVTDFRKEILRVKGNCVVVSDVHYPHHNDEVIEKVLAAGRRHKLKTLVIGGDYFDWDGISRHRKIKEFDSKIPEIMAGGMKLLADLCKWFEKVYIIKGNHDDRLQRLLETAIEGLNGPQKILMVLQDPKKEFEGLDYRHRFVKIMKVWTKHCEPKIANKVVWLPGPVIEIAGPKGLDPYRLTHPSIYSKNAPQAERMLWSANVQPILGTHGHIFGVSIAPNGLHPILQFGCATDNFKHLYLYESDTAHPRWVQGFCVIVEGRVKTYTNNPYFLEWSELT